MTIGKLKHRLTLQEAVRTADNAGGFSKSWQNLTATPVVSAAITPVASRDLLSFQQTETRVTHRLTLRWRNDIVPGMRALSGSRVFMITAVTNNGDQNRFLDLLAYEEIA